MAATVALVSWLTGGAATAVAIAEEGSTEFFDGAYAPMVAPSSPLYSILLRACPDARIESTELDAVRVVEGKLAIAAAMRAAALAAAEPGVVYGKPGTDGSYRFANTPREAATAIRQALGPSSLLARGADAIAFLTDTIEYTTQVPLDRVNDLTDVLVEHARRAGLRNFPVLRLRSRIENDRAGVTLSARW